MTGLLSRLPRPKAKRFLTTNNTNLTNLPSGRTCAPRPFTGPFVRFVVRGLNSCLRPIPRHSGGGEKIPREEGRLVACHCRKPRVRAHGL